MENQPRNVGVAQLAPEGGGLRWSLMGALALGLTFAMVLLFGSQAFGAPGTTRTVGTTPGCDTIQDCENASAAGDTVRIPAGVYPENVTVDVDIKIEGTNCENRSAVVVNATPGGVEGVGFTVTANGVTIRCLSVRNGSDGIDVGGGAPANNVTLRRLVVEGSNSENVLATGDGLTVEDSTFLSSGDEGIELTGNNAEIRRITLRGHDSDCVEIVEGNNTAIRASYATRCEDGAGFDVSGADNLIRGSTMVFTEEGIDFSSNDAPRVINNTVRGTGDAPINIDCNARCEDGLIQGNRARGGADDDNGFEIDTSAPGLRILDNKAIDNNGAGFDLGITGAIVSGNTAEFNGSEGTSEAHGFDIVGSDNLFEDNVARRNKRDGFYLESGSTNVFRDNTSNTNSKDGFDLDDTAGSGNRLINNTANNNRAEGFENNALLTDVIRNEAGGNGIDCANSGTIDQNTDNTCADGSDFTVPPEVE